MDGLQASYAHPSLSYPHKGTFWKEFWQEYSRITHFHGFHEIRHSPHRFNKIFWAGVIVMGFAFAFSLTTVGILHFTKDPVDTHVTSVPQGEIDFPVLYCPKYWIDKNRLINGSEKHLLYALSYLRIPTYVYIPYEKMKPYSLSLPPPRFNDIPSFLTNMTSFQMAVYLTGKTPPSYYIGNSRLVMGSIPSLSYLFQWSNDQTKLINYMYPIYTQNRTGDLFHYVYYNMTFSILVARDVYNDTFKENFSQATSVWATVNLGQYDNDECFTLNDLDQIDKLKEDYFNKNLTDWPCHYEEQKYESVQNETYWTNIVNKHDWFLKLFNSSIFTRICNRDNDKYCARDQSDQKERIYLENQRSRRMIELISTDKKINRNAKSSNEEAIKGYLNTCCNDNISKFDEEVKRLLSNAERRFLVEEKSEFENFMKNNSLGTVLDYLKHVSFDESRFMVSFSMDSQKHIRPNSSNITAKRVVMADGTCILFRIQLDANTVGGWVRDDDNMQIIQDDDHYQDDVQYPGERSSFDIFSLSPIKTAYINIVMRQNTESMFAARDTNIVSFGESAYANSQEFFDGVKFPIEFSKFQPTNEYYRITIESVRNVNAIYRSMTPCKERDLDSDDNIGALPYSYSGCLLSCNDQFSNPKTVCGRTQNGTGLACRELATCIYLAENRIAPKGVEACSFFNLHQIYETWTPNPKILRVNSTNKLECFHKCFPPCQSLSFQIQKTVKDAESFTVSRYSDNLIALTTNDTKKRKEIIWIPENFFWDISTYLNQMYQKDQTAQSRIEIQISTELTTYEEQPSFTWDTLFGVVGGQIGLVMGASCLTVIQFIWFFTMSLFRHFSGRTRFLNLSKINHSVPPMENRPSIIFIPKDRL